MCDSRHAERGIGRRRFARAPVDDGLAVLDAAIAGAAIAKDADIDLGLIRQRGQQRIARAEDAVVIMRAEHGDALVAWASTLGRADRSARSLMRRWKS